MLQYLKINSFLLFEKQEIDLQGNFTVITGETGSGKSMLIKALRFVLGEKIENIDNLTSEISVTAGFELSKSDNKSLIKILEENDIFIEDEIIIRRTSGENNRGKVFVNDNVVTQNLLKKISNELVEFHSQHKQLEAFNQNNALNIIDQFAKTDEKLDQVKNLYHKISNLEKEIERAQTEKDTIQNDYEYIQYSFNEIKKLNPKQGEELELAEKKSNYSNRVKIKDTLENLLNIFDKDNSAIQKLIRIQREISKYPEIQELDEQIEQCALSISNLQDSTEIKLRDLNFEENYEEIEERLSKIKELCRKYRCTSDQLLNIQEENQQKLEKFKTISSEIEEKNKSKSNLMKEYFVIAEELSLIRKNSIKTLEEKVISELKELRLEHVEFKVDIVSDNLRPIKVSGIDQAKFLIKTNKGFPFAQVHEIASGGELSRIMLAFKVALAKVSKKSTIIFDEIDAGTGGAVAETIGLRLKKLADSNQIIAISHQPQVASKATQHLYVEKIFLNKNEAVIKNLNSQERVQEIARMLAGVNVTDSAIKAALTLIDGSTS